MKENNPLLTRKEFKEKVFAQTNGKCCVPGCDCDAADAHHIMDRKLWNDGGYYLSNGAALCAKHHLDAEQGRIAPRQCIEYMGISFGDIRIPDALKEEYTHPVFAYDLAIKNDKIDKWGNKIEQKDYDPDWYKKYE